MVRNKASQKSLGYGFVSFKDPWDMTKALREMHGKYIGNRPVKVRNTHTLFVLLSTLGIGLSGSGIYAHRTPTPETQPPNP